MPLSHLIRRARFWLAALPVLVIALSLACALPFLPGQKTPTPASPVLGATATTPPESLPPALVESNPLPGSEVPLDSPIVLRFNQPMNRASVEAAVQIGGASGSFEWQDDTTMTFKPDASLLPDTELNLRISVTAQSQKGMPLHKPVELRYRTAGYLALTQMLPENGQQEVDPSSAIVAAFNRPVVPLGADPATLPPAFTLEPAASGRGEWINTSTFILYPDPPLSGGFDYTVRPNAELKSTGGSPLQNADASWTFKVAPPRVLEFTPTDPINVPLDTPIWVRFNQRMDPESVNRGFSVRPVGQEPVSGTATWDETFTTLVFTPTSLLGRGGTYEMRLEPAALSAGGIPLGESLQVSWTTVGDFSLAGSNPAFGGLMESWQSLQLTFSSPLPDTDFAPFFRFEPAVDDLRISFDQSDFTLSLFANFLPNTAYTLFIDPALADRYGQALGEPAQLLFRTAPLQPLLENPGGQGVLFLTTQDTGLSVQLTNHFNLQLTRYTVPLGDFFALASSGGYDLRQAYQSENRQTWTAPFDIPPDRSTRVQLPLNPENEPLPPGIYLVRADLGAKQAYDTSFVVVVSDVHLTYKISASDVLVWAVDTRTYEPVTSAPVVVYDENGEVLVSGSTDADGIFRSGLPRLLSPFESNTVVLGQPGEALFSAAVADWNQGLEPFTFGITADYRGPRLTTYLYTDRPIYRPGQTVYFRGIARNRNNGRYSLPAEISTLPIVLFDSEGAELARYDLPLSAFGAAHGEYALIADARPGYYRLESGEDTIYFQVAEYRKPEINLQVAFSQTQALGGESLTASVNARYFFDAPAGNVKLGWALYEAPDTFQIPDYQTGLTDDRWLYGSFFGPFFGLGNLVAQGTAQTGPDGLASLELPNPNVSEQPGRATRRLTLEVTATDESGLPVSARASIRIHPAVFYIGIRPDVWVGQAGQETGYSVQVVDWENNPAGSRSLKATFSRVVYKRVDPPPDRPYEYPTYSPEYTEISSSDFATGPDGMARLAFTAPGPGTYQLEISGEGARTQVLLWFGGPGQAVWPSLPNQRLRLTADRETYQPGETAQVFVPNPFPGTVTALLTVERGIVMRHEVHRLPPGGETLAIPLGDDDAPNVYVSLTILGENETGQVDIRQGHTRLEVNPRQQTLNVELTRQPERSGPGGEVTFGLRVTDADGNPVQGEFSLAVVDLAVLALADPNAPQIVPAFYGQQPLGVRTSLSLAGYANRSASFEGGIGGGGAGEAAPVVRQEFPDTAYWNATLVTDGNGQATVTVSLPDSLTTWQVDVRGLTADTLVGQAQAEVVTTQEVLVRPATPRFLVAGDHALLAAIVQNNTSANLTAQVSLEAKGVTLDEDQAMVQQAALPAGGRARLEWWGTVQDVSTADLVFSVQAGEYQDAARPALGALPVLRYTARQAFATAGFLEGAVQQLELVSLPAGALIDPASAGELRLELAPSLAAAMLTSLDALEYYEYECTEQLLARFLPNLLLHQALQAFDINLPEVESRLERTLQPGVAKLVARQNLDGGWGWWPGSEESSPYITAYALFGLAQAQQAGVNLSADVIQRAIDYLKAVQVAPGQVSQPYELDRLAFQQFALAQAGASDPDGARALYAARDQLSPWAQGLLALALEAGASGSPEAADLLGSLQATAQHSATGAFWSDPAPRWQNLNTTVTTTAMVVYALAEKEPASTLLPDAIRFIMASRGAQGYWGSTFETTWALLAATSYMKGTGELGGDYDFRATLNNAPLASGQAGGDTRLRPVLAAAPVSSLYPADPNALRIERSGDSGRLYYTALLDVAFPADQVAPLNRGLTVERAYYNPAGCTQESCPQVDAASAGEQVTVRLTLVVPQDAYYVVLEDFIPAGSEILDRSLKTSQLGVPELELGETEPGPRYDPSVPFAQGWGWWYFSQPAVFDDHIAWAASYLPAGTYELVYTLTLLQPGEYRLLPARAFQFYFPDVQGNSAGGLFNILRP